MKKLLPIMASLLMVGVSQASIIGIQAESGTFDSANWATITQATIDGANAPLNTETLGGGSAIMADGANKFGAADAARSADFSVTVADAGSYTLWARYIIPDLEDFATSTQAADSNDSFNYTAFDADSTDSASFNTLTPAGTSDLANYIQLGETQALTVGAHTFSVAPRENGFVLDAFVVTDEAFNEAAFDAVAIPEPATLGLIASFGGIILFIRKRLMI